MRKEFPLASSNKSISLQPVACWQGCCPGRDAFGVLTAALDGAGTDPLFWVCFYEHKTPVSPFNKDLDPVQVLKCQGHAWRHENYLITLFRGRGLGQQCQHGGFSIQEAWAGIFTFLAGWLAAELT